MQEWTVARFFSGQVTWEACPVWQLNGFQVYLSTVGTRLLEHLQTIPETTHPHPSLTHPHPSLTHLYMRQGILTKLPEFCNHPTAARCRSLIPFHQDGIRQFPRLMKDMSFKNPPLITWWTHRSLLTSSIQYQLLGFEFVHCVHSSFDLWKASNKVSKENLRIECQTPCAWCTREESWHDWVMPWLMILRSGLLFS